MRKFVNAVVENCLNFGAHFFWHLFDFCSDLSESEDDSSDHESINVASRSKNVPRPVKKNDQSSVCIFKIRERNL